VPTLDRLGLWVQLAVISDGGAGRVVYYFNGQPVGESELRIKPPYRIAAAEIGNWDARGFPQNRPSTVRNFSGAMDEFCLFSRALSADEIERLYSAGKPQPDPQVQTRK
jgi:hypothetical protein